MTRTNFMAIVFSLFFGIFAGAVTADANPFDDFLDDVLPVVNPGPARVVDLGERTADKFITNEHRFDVPGRARRGVRAVVLRGTKKTVDIRSVEVVYRSGRVEHLNYLTGILREGERIRQRINPGRVVQVIVNATSPHLFGSRGKYKVILRVRN